MLTYDYRVGGDPVQVRVPETSADLGAFRDWLTRRADQPIALDTETTGLDLYSAAFRLRTVQLGDRDTGWVLHWERGAPFQATARWALERAERLLIHNAAYDWAVLDRHVGVRIESLAPRTTDTRLLAGLVDPRQPQEGGIGTGLKSLSAHYLDPSAPDTQGDLTAVFRSLKLTKASGWAQIPLDHPTYNLYAGLDVILTARLEPALRRELDRLGVRPKLVAYEHELARICAVMQRTGMVLDVDYTRRLNTRLAEMQEAAEARARSFGVENVHAVAQIRDALLGMGEKWSDKTDTGALRVDKAVLHRFADLDPRRGTRLGLRDPNPLAQAIIESKRAGKWRAAYTEAFLETVDTAGRVHPHINSMQARTSRMSITRPALQTLPSSDGLIRSCLLAEEGHVMCSTDFQAIEMRVLAALADVRKMKEGFISAGDTDFDIHMYTARLVKGPGATAEDRKIFKGAGFGKVYGGGVKTLARQTGASEEEIRRAVEAYDREYPEIKRASARWQRQARETGLVHVSATGRRLPLDRDRMYAIVNYACQSVARDCLGQALIHMDEAGLLPYLRLPIHDEVVYSTPRSEVQDVTHEVEKCMTFRLMGVPIVADSKVGDRSWGSLYPTQHILT